MVARRCPSPVDLEPEFVLSEPQPVMPPTLSGMKQGRALEDPVDLLSGAESCGNDENIADTNRSETAKTGKKCNNKENNGDDEQEEGKNCNDEDNGGNKQRKKCNKDKDANNEETEDEDDQDLEAITVESMDSDGDFIQSENLLLVETGPEDKHYKDEGQELEEYEWEG